jgi:D-alanyl-D-alanine carboxypeptidase
VIPGVLLFTLVLLPGPLTNTMPPLTSVPVLVAAPTAAPVVPPHRGDYSPNTTIEQRGDELWFIRPPYESPLVPNGDGTYHFLHGWLAGRHMYFTPNEAGGTSILVLADDGSWNEFARSGEIYDDLDPALIDALEGVLEHELAIAPHVPGAVLAVHLPGQGRWVGARGVSSRAHGGVPMVPHDRIHAASVSKLFVATVILQMHAEGTLSLDDTVEQWMPLLVPNGEHITLRHLLNHTSGIYNYLDDGFISHALRDRQRIWSQQELAMRGAIGQPYFSPGEPGRWHYSNTNYVLLGMVVEHATGTSLAQQVRWRILDSLGLHDTFFEPYETTSGGVAPGYLGNEDVSDMNMSIVWGAGGIVSTADDLSRFAQALFGGELLGPAEMQEMHRFVSVDGAWGTRDLVYGLGLMQDQMGIAPDSAGNPRPVTLGTVRGHTGALAGYRTAVWYLPASGAVVVVGANQMYYDANIIATAAINVLLAHAEHMQ